MAFSHRETRVVKGMLLRGDKQHDVAAYFGVNGGRVAEVALGKCDYPNALPFPENELPPVGPYASPYNVNKARKVLLDLQEELKNSERNHVLDHVQERLAVALKHLI